MSGTECRLLCALGAEPTRVFTRDDLMPAIWGHIAAARTRTPDSHVCRLRSKVATATHPVVFNVWAVCLQFVAATPV